MGKEPLVSVVILTYNSANFIEETLESIYNQTYNNIELIITDDCSKDNTIHLCEQWINTHKGRFIRAEIIKSPTNTGIPANCNRGYDACNGEWIKAIAGDDCLYPNAIDRYISIARKNGATLLFSSMDIYKDDFNLCNKIVSHVLPSALFKANKATAKEQFKLLTLGNEIFAPTVIMKKETFYDNNKYDEDIKLCEDWPMWLKLTNNGYRFYYIDEVLVRYRQYSQSTWGKQSINIKYIVTNGEEFINKVYIYPYVDCTNRIFLKINLFTRKKLNEIASKKSLILYLYILKAIKFISDKYIHFMSRLYNHKFMKQ